MADDGWQILDEVFELLKQTVNRISFNFFADIYPYENHPRI